jgi:hypothetical protein
MNLFDHRLAAILKIRAALAAQMFELRELRRRVQIAQLSQDDEGECAQDRAF